MSGCYDLLHAGHIQFFNEAKSRGGPGATLTVSFASEEVLWHHKRRRPSIPDGHKQVLISSLRMVDAVVLGTDTDTKGLDFKTWFLDTRPTMLVVTEDDKYAPAKRELCARINAEYIALPKTPPLIPPVSTTSLLMGICAPRTVPLRVDFGGGWLDVPRHKKGGGAVVNCAISPLVTLEDWAGYNLKSGLGGSGAYALLKGRNGVQAEVEDLGVGWQDPAVIEETGVCVWVSGDTPKLRFKSSGEWLRGKMAIWWTGEAHDTPGNADNKRNYADIEKAGKMCAEAVIGEDITALGKGISMSYHAQIGEGMKELPDIAGAVGWKYCGGGWGGYAVYVFHEMERRDEVCRGEGWKSIEPFCKEVGKQATWN